MSESINHKFIQGPWVCEDEPGRSLIMKHADHEPHENCTGNLIVAEITGDSDFCRGNARLIAAAPDMYDKLVEVEKVIAEWPTIHEGGDYLHGWILNSIREVLDKAKPKAEGGTQ
jgi:hypothetical protein